MKSRPCVVRLVRRFGSCQVNCTSRLYIQVVYASSENGRGLAAIARDSQDFSRSLVADFAQARFINRAYLIQDSLTTFCLKTEGEGGSANLRKSGGLGYGTASALEQEAV